MSRSPRFTRLFPISAISAFSAVSFFSAGVVFANRQEKKVDANGNGTFDTTQKYAYDGWKTGQQGWFVGNENHDVFADLDGSGSLTTRYVRGDVIDQVFARLDGTTPYWYLTDHLGSIRDVTDGAGVVKNHITYDAFGNILSETDSAFRGRYAWTGREFDVETGLQYNRARYYDATIGRWTSQDPLGFEAGDGNLYRYSHNAPVLFSDPSGLKEPIPFLAGSSTDVEKGTATVGLNIQLENPSHKMHGGYLFLRVITPSVYVRKVNKDGSLGDALEGYRGSETGLPQITGRTSEYWLATRVQPNTTFTPRTVIPKRPGLDPSTYFYSIERVPQTVGIVNVYIEVAYVDGLSENAWQALKDLDRWQVSNAASDKVVYDVPRLFDFNTVLGWGPHRIRRWDLEKCGQSPKDLGIYRRSDFVLQFRWEPEKDIQVFLNKDTVLLKP